MKPWYQSKTFWIQALTLVTGIVTVFSASELIPEKTVLFLVSIVIPVINVMVRWLTDQPITSFSKRFDSLPGRKEVVKRVKNNG